MSKDTNNTIGNAIGTVSRKETTPAVQPQTASAVELLARQADAQFAMTPMGQALKQFEICQRMGQLFSQTSIVPDTYKNNMPNCAVAIDMAMRMGMPPVMVMQNLYVVHGNPAWSSKFLIACVNGCGRFSSLEYHRVNADKPSADEYGYQCVAYAKSDVNRTNPLEGPVVDWRMVKAEGWLAKNGSKWKTMPEVMFRYRAAALWQRLYAPEIAMGINTVEEAYDIPDSRPVDVEYKEVKIKADAEPAPAEVSDELLQQAFDALEKATTADAVKGVKQNFKFVYENSEMFRDALIDHYQTLQQQQQPQQPSEGES